MSDKEIMPLIDAETRIKVLAEYLEEHPDHLPPECEFAYLQKMLKAQRDVDLKVLEAYQKRITELQETCKDWGRLMEAREKEWEALLVKEQEMMTWMARHVRGEEADKEAEWLENWKNRNDSPYQDLEWHIKELRRIAEGK